MKTLLLTLLLLLTITAAWAQSPQRISYQSIIRDANNVVVASSAVSVKISLLRGTSTGPAVYVETHPITTNANGLVSLNIGEGRAISGRFAEIDWSNGPYLIQTATDPTGGTDYSIVGTAPLNSVPYALNAANAGIANSLAGTLAIASGGTGATTATAARAALGLENVDNTTDLLKPVSTAVQTALSTKVDKVNGKELSTNDYSTAEKAKLAAITGSNTGDQDLSALATTAAVAQKANATDVTTSLATKVDKVSGKELSTNDYTTAEKTKLAAITGTNSGDQDLSTLATTAAVAQKANATDVTTSLATKVDKVTGKELSTNDYTTAEKTKLAAITGTNTGDQDLSALATTAAVALKANATEVATSLATKVDKVTGKELSTNDYTTAEKTKLAAITGTNTGDQDLSALATTAAVALKADATDVTTSLATKVDKVTGKELSTNDYTTAEKTKLAAITGTNTGDQTNIAGNAATATKLLTAVTINGIAFDGSTNVTIPATGAVPYTGATQAVDLGAYDLKVNGLTIGRGAGNVDGNTANGSMSLYSNSSGNSNTAYGYASLYSNTTGSSNIANGNQSLYFNTTGSNNTAIGNASLNSNIEGVDNTANGFGALYRNTGGYNTASGSRSLYSNTTGASNTALGYSAGTTNTTGTQNTLIGYSADVAANNLSNATALGNQAIVTASNTIQLGNTSVTNVKTSGTLTAGAVTYPNTVGSNGQVLTTDGLGAASWASAPTYSIGLNPALGGYVFYVTPDGKHGLVAETQDQFGANDFPFIPGEGSYGLAQDNLANPTKHSTDGANFSDWRIPSRYEMLLMYNTIGPGATGANQNIGNFDANRYYLTSTIYDSRYLFYVDFSTGNSSSSQRFPIYPFSYLGDKESVRAVRSF